MASFKGHFYCTTAFKNNGNLPIGKIMIFYFKALDPQEACSGNVFPFIRTK